MNKIIETGWLVLRTFCAALLPALGALGLVFAAASMWPATAGP